LLSLSLSLGFAGQLLLRFRTSSVLIMGSIDRRVMNNLDTDGVPYTRAQFLEWFHRPGTEFALREWEAGQRVDRDGELLQGESDRLQADHSSHRAGGYQRVRTGTGRQPPQQPPQGTLVWAGGYQRVRTGTGRQPPQQPPQRPQFPPGWWLPPGSNRNRKTTTAEPRQQQPPQHGGQASQERLIRLPAIEEDVEEFATEGGLRLSLVAAPLDVRAEPSYRTSSCSKGCSSLTFFSASRLLDAVHAEDTGHPGLKKFNALECRALLQGKVPPVLVAKDPVECLGKLEAWWQSSSAAQSHKWRQEVQIQNKWRQRLSTALRPVPGCP
jgi:hypothetical protein